MSSPDAFDFCARAEELAADLAAVQRFAGAASAGKTAASVGEASSPDAFGFGTRAEELAQ